MILYFADMQQLIAINAEYKAKAFSSNTNITRNAQIKKYQEFVNLYSEMAPVPCDCVQTALYASWLAISMKYSSVLNYLSALSAYLQSLGFDPIDYKSYHLSSTLKGIRRSLGDVKRQALPILPSMLLKMFDHITMSKGHISWRAAVLCSFRGLLRKSQVTLSDSSLKRSNFKFFSWGMIISLTRTKTIQFSERHLCIPITKCLNKSLCAVYWTQLHFNQIVTRQDQTAFNIPCDNTLGYTPLTYSVYNDSIKYFAGEAGYSPSSFSSHSLRRGGATYLSVSGASIEEIKSRGDWKSDCVYQYLRTPMDIRIVNDMKVASMLAKVD